MELSSQLREKLEPYAERVRQGKGQDTDFLPATLLHLVDGQDVVGRNSANTLSQVAAAQARLSALGTEHAQAANALRGELKTAMKSAEEAHASAHSEIMSRLAESEQKSDEVREKSRNDHDRRLNDLRTHFERTIGTQLQVTLQRHERLEAGVAELALDLRQTQRAHLRHTAVIVASVVLGVAALIATLVSR